MFYNYIVAKVDSIVNEMERCFNFIDRYHDQASNDKIRSSMFQKGNQIIMFVFMAIGLILMILTMGIEVTDDGECVNCGIEGSFIGSPISSCD